ncbi:MAG TPA: hypothetical protein VFG54_22100 [Prolixibacteraceae bacterium]|nr:hypothetical protein [Prolixibacteraceae bacterium]
MENEKKSLGVFIHFSNSKYIPYYVLLYLRELTHHFDEVIFIANKRSIKNEKALHHSNVKTHFVKNEGYDLGMFYKVFQTINPDDYRQIACINDSNILFNKLTTIFSWGKSSGMDFWGLIDSHERPPFSTHEENYHIQSHFLVFNEKAVALLPEYFSSIDMENIFKEADVQKLRHRVIDQWEIGVSRFMINNGLKIGSYINGQIYTNLYIPGELQNISRRLYPHLIEAGYPLIKKKVIMDRQLKHYLKLMPSWKKLMRQYGSKDWAIENLVQEMTEIRNKSPKRISNKIKKHLQNVRILPLNMNEESHG